jgi:glutathione S-transferase
VITLYRAPLSTNVERVALALAFKHVIDVESVVIGYDDRTLVEQVSGQPLVPVLVDDDVVVPDSMRIIRHLEERFPDPPLYPSDPGRLAEMLVFIDWFNRVWKVPPNAIEAELGHAQPDAAVIERLSRELADALDLFEQLLADRPFLFGDSFSAADCAAFPFLKFAWGLPEGDDQLFHRVLAEHQPLGSTHLRLAEWIARIDDYPRA